MTRKNKQGGKLMVSRNLSLAVVDEASTDFGSFTVGLQNSMRATLKELCSTAYVDKVVLTFQVDHCYDTTALGGGKPRTWWGRLYVVSDVRTNHSPANGAELVEADWAHPQDYHNFEMSDRKRTVRVTIPLHEVVDLESGGEADEDEDPHTVWYYVEFLTEGYTTAAGTVDVIQEVYYRPILRK